jgi:hypothetical protein
MKFLKDLVWMTSTVNVIRLANLSKTAQESIVRSTAITRKKLMCNQLSPVAMIMSVKSMRNARLLQVAPVTTVKRLAKRRNQVEM